MPDTDDLALALRLADTADAITTDRYGARDLWVARKPDRSPVTDADLAVEDAARAILATERPADTVIGEERGGASGAASGDDGDARAWLLDPIDGTKNFLRGVPAWATLIGLVAGDEPILGVVSAPALGRRWWACRGRGAWVSTSTDGADGGGAPRRMSVSAVGSLADAYLSTTDLGSWVEYHSRESYLALVDACWESRAFGDFWQHCLVAEGALDVAAEPIVNPWDVAGIQVIVEEAGGRFTDLSGSRRYDTGTALTSNGLVHDAALTVLRSAGPGRRGIP